MIRIHFTLLCALLSANISAQLSFTNCNLAYIRQVNEVEIGDFNNDGLMDIAAIGFNTVYALMNNSNGYDKILILETLDPRHMEVADFNADGNMDIAILDTTTNSLKILENNGAASPEYVVHEYNFGKSPLALKTSDINGDGLTDLLIGFGGGFQPGDRLVHVINEGDFGFTRNSGFLNSIRYFRSFDVFDTNGDGLQDVLLLGNDSIFTYINDGMSLNFEKQVVSDTRAPGPVASGDINNDGRLDFMVSTLFDGLLLFTNTEQGFTEEVIDPDLIISRPLTLADLDGDGDLDILLSENAEALTYYINEAGTFNKFLLIDDSFYGNNITTFDADNDGDLDILASSIELESVFLFKNESTSATEDHTTLSPISIYPNPSEDHVNIVSELKIIRINLYDSYANRISSSMTNKIDIRDLASGIYYLEIETEEGSFTKSITKK